MPLGPAAIAAISAGIPAVTSLISQIAQRRSERKEYNRMLEYNTPAAQMQRYRDAGLSPYLIYGAASAGNATVPAPPVAAPDPGPHIGKGLAEYMTYAGWQADQKLKFWGNQLGRFNAKTAALKSDEVERDLIRKELELMSDFPDLVGEFAVNGRWIPEGAARNSFRMKMNELKRGAAEASINRIESIIDGINYKNVVERIKAKYADEFGMVGGDWTQGLGLLKSIPSMFKGAKKIPANEKALIDSYRKFKGDQYKRDANRFLFEQLKN